MFAPSFMPSPVFSAPVTPPTCPLRASRSDAEQVLGGLSIGPKPQDPLTSAATTAVHGVVTPDTLPTPSSLAPATRDRCWRDRRPWAGAAPPNSGVRPVLTPPHGAPCSAPPCLTAGFGVWVLVGLLPPRTCPPVLENETCAPPSRVHAPVQVKAIWCPHSWTLPLSAGHNLLSTLMPSAVPRVSKPLGQGQPLPVIRRLSLSEPREGWEGAVGVLPLTAGWEGWWGALICAVAPVWPPTHPCCGQAPSGLSGLALGTSRVHRGPQTFRRGGDGGKRGVLSVL